jgi:carbonic anhydrase
METIAMLERIIGGKRALIITCMECCLDIEQRISGEVYRYSILGNILNPQDNYQTQSILSFVEFKRCCKIIVAGHTDCKALNYILNSDTKILFSGHSRVELRQIVNNNHGHLLSESVKNRVLVEQNVIAQCHALLGYEAIRQRFADQAISVIGVVVGLSGSCVQVFSNGTAYNNFLSMN